MATNKKTPEFEEGFQEGSTGIRSSVRTLSKNGGHLNPGSLTSGPPSTLMHTSIPKDDQTSASFDSGQQISTGQPSTGDILNTLPNLEVSTVSVRPNSAGSISHRNDSGTSTGGTLDNEISDVTHTGTEPLSSMDIGPLLAQDLEDLDKAMAEWEGIYSTFPPVIDNNIGMAGAEPGNPKPLHLPNSPYASKVHAQPPVEPQPAPKPELTKQAVPPTPMPRQSKSTAQPQKNTGPPPRRSTTEIHRPMVVDMDVRPKTKYTTSNKSSNSTTPAGGYTNFTNFSQKSTVQIRSPSSPADADLDKLNVSSSPGDRVPESMQFVKNKNESDPINSGSESLPAKISGGITDITEQEAIGKYRLHMQSGKLKESQGKSNEAAVEFKKALEYGEIAYGRNSLDIAKTMGIIGRLYQKRGRHNDAREALERELQIYKDNGYTADNHPDELWAAHDILAQAYDGLKNSRKEIEHYEKSIEIVQATTVPPERLPHMHNNVGNAYRASGNLNKAREHLETAKFMMELVHCDEPVEDMAKVHSSLGDVYHDMRMIEEAITELEICICIREKTRPGPEGELIRGGTHQTLASLYEQLGNKEKQEYHLGKSKSGLQGLMGTDKDRESLLQNLEGMVKGHNATGVLGKLAAGLTASGDINKAQQYQAENDSLNAIEHYNKGIASMKQLPPDIQQSEEILSTLALCHNNVGNSYRKIHRFTEAEFHLSAALDIRRRLFADEPSDDTASTLFNLGHLLQSLGGRTNVQKAIDLHEECLKMYLKLGGVDCHTNWIVSLYRSLGQGYERLNNSRKSIENYERAKQILIDKGGDLDELRAVCNNMGNSYESIGEYKKAEENIQMALNMSVILSDEKPHDLELQNHIAAGHNNLGVLYQTWDKLGLALEHLYKSKELREQIKHDNMEAAHDVASSYHNIGNTLIKMGDLQKALENYEEELKIRTNLGEDTSGVRVAMSNVYERLGDSTKAMQILTV